MAKVQEKGDTLRSAPKELQNDKEVVMAAILSDGTALEFASEALRHNKSFLLDAVKATKASWLIKYCPGLETDADFVKELAAAAGTGLIFSYYTNASCFYGMRDRFEATGASVPGGQAYAQVMEELRKTSGGSATVWFDELPVFGFSADEGRWIHPSADCGRDEVPVPAASSERHAMWNCLVESRSQRMPPEVGSKHPCWCCHWLRQVRRRHQEGAVICCAVSNIYNAAWVERYGAGSSELSDARAREFGLKREMFHNGRPRGWGEGDIEIKGAGTFSRVAPVHPHTLRPLGEGCRWERQALDGLDFPVYVFFMP
ncbi:unnamed protein product [Durusdinium trenchii]